MHSAPRLLVGLFVASMVLGVWGAEPAAACSCVPASESDYLAAAAAVFVGTATAVDGPQPGAA